MPGCKEGVCESGFLVFDGVVDEVVISDSLVPAVIVSLSTLLNVSDSMIGNIEIGPVGGLIEGDIRMLNVSDSVFDRGNKDLLEGSLLNIVLVRSSFDLIMNTTKQHVRILNSYQLRADSFSG
eukprot:TRINITY_DN12804_c0_g1_i1.p1 TRINITY_DN12804_c0_g1~~TRINITY_DN12804_c0_g1_i1.p1  ORF type:complete len:123 (-),score=24.03 TRINITY_DN12804_c0_g1_i1:91-459(-)